MNLQFDIQKAANYKSPAQIARVLSEDWAERNLYCPSCDADKLSQLTDNTKVFDFRCIHCQEMYQVKSQSKPFGSRIVDSAYSPMIQSIKENKAPHLFVLNYDSNSMSALNLLIIPKFFLNISCIEKRKPLSSNARRAGWVGCNILLNQLPEDGRIFIIRKGQPILPKTVREHFARFRFLEKKKYDSRGWTADVLKFVSDIGKQEFLLEDIYKYENKLKQLHPDNFHVKDKIRQQLQVLRDEGILHFTDRGKYQLLK